MSGQRFSKILIANRGEIACRIIRSARAMGIATVAVYSDADSQAWHVQQADEAIYIGASPSRESYLDGDKIIQAALRTKAQAIHPGYGFLSENASFCQACADHNIVFIGPPIEAIKAMGSKSAAKNIMAEAGVPLVPGYHGDDQSRQVIRQAADAMGYPVLLKAVAGGGGKGMRQVWQHDEFDHAFDAAKREAMNGFGNDDMLVEKYLTQPRHVEVQVFCDQYNNAVYLFERDCSLQRRHQKVIEEAPAPGLSESLRQQMGQAAVRAAQAIDYQGAGTVEFLLDSDNSFYFMEMNTRLQVEHPVTEMITGQDLVEWQLRVAAGETLPLQQHELRLHGHAFEARIYAEDPDNDFLPVTGQLTLLHPPTQNRYVRVDTGVQQGDEVSVYYDPMIAKLIVWDEDRDKALQRFTTALQQYRIGGMKTNIAFLYNLANTDAFKACDLDTGFIDKHHDAIFPAAPATTAEDVALAALYIILLQNQTIQCAADTTQDTDSPWNDCHNWRMNEAATHALTINICGEIYTITAEVVCGGTPPRYRLRYNNEIIDAHGNLDNQHTLSANLDGHLMHATAADLGHDEYQLYNATKTIAVSIVRPDLGQHDDDVDGHGLTAPMNGTMVSLLVEPGCKVNKGQPLLIMEAMKMEHTIVAPADGSVGEFYYHPGDLVDGGAALLHFDVAGEDEK